MYKRHGALQLVLMHNDIWEWRMPQILGDLKFSVSSVISGEGDGTPLQYSCLANPMDGGAWWAAVHGVAKSRTRLSDFTFTFHFHALEKEMATHCSVLAWRMPGTGEPGGLLSMGSHRVGHDWSDLAAAVLFLEKEMATHSSVLAWRIPGTADPGELRSMGSQRVGHNWSDLAAAVRY